VSFGVSARFCDSIAPCARPHLFLYTFVQSLAHTILHFSSRILPAATFQSALSDYLATILQGNHPVAILKAKSMIREVQLRTLLEGQQKSSEMMASHSITGIPAQQIAKKAAELKGEKRVGVVVGG
jgi:hypothetical protein